jgi:hypothetical protein
MITSDALDCGLSAPSRFRFNALDGGGVRATKRAFTNHEQIRRNPLTGGVSKEFENAFFRDP